MSGRGGCLLTSPPLLLTCNVLQCRSHSRVEYTWPTSCGEHMQLQQQSDAQNPNVTSSRGTTCVRSAAQPNLPVLHVCDCADASAAVLMLLLLQKQCWLFASQCFWVCVGLVSHRLGCHRL
jgi:hypothetical protein